MSVRCAEILLLTALIVRSSSFLFSKIALETMEPFTLLCLRSLIAFLVLAFIFRKHLAQITKETVFHGALIGGAFFIVMVFELYGLRTTPASVTVFIENTAIVFVPLFSIFLTRRLPGISTVISSAAALIGVAFLTLKNGGGSFTAGELLCFGAALTYAAAILITDRAAKEDDALALGILPNGFMRLFSIPAAFFMETPALPEARPPGSASSSLPSSASSSASPSSRSPRNTWTPTAQNSSVPSPRCPRYSSAPYS